jgi:hypothetical protein
MILIESMFCPPIPVVAAMASNDTVVLEAHEHYQKRSFRNRMYLKTAQGRELFSIPLQKGKNQQCKISEVKTIQEDDWVLHLTKVLRTNYGSAPYYLDYIDGLLDAVRKDHHSLFHLNMHVLSWILDGIGVSADIMQSSTYETAVDPEVIDLRNKFVPSESYFSSQDHIVYPQVHEERHPFCGGLSVIDILFSCGPETIVYLKQI